MLRNHSRLPLEQQALWAELGKVVLPLTKYVA